MADAETFTFRNEADEEQTINKSDLIAAIPAPTGPSSTIIYVEHNESDQTAAPKVAFKKGSPDIAAERPSLTTAHETHIIISTGSGKKEAENFYKDALSPVLEALFPASHGSFHVHRTESESSVLQLARTVFFPKANADILLRIIILSGDGGVIDLVNGLLSRPSSLNYVPPQVILLPLGTANALYHSINAGQDNTWGLRALDVDNYKPLPIFTATFSSGARLLVDEARSEEELSKHIHTGDPVLHGAVVASWGMHASLVADSDSSEYRKFGIDRFKMAAKEALYPANGSPPHPYKAKVSALKGDKWQDLPVEEHMYVLATLVSNLEKTFTISPSSKPLDGSLHLVQFGPTSGDEAMRIMGLAYQGGKHVEDSSVRYESIDGLRVQFDGREDDARWRRICIDGKIVRLEKDGWVEVRKISKRVFEVASP